MDFLPNEYTLIWTENSHIDLCCALVNIYIFSISVITLTCHVLKVKAVSLKWKMIMLMMKTAYRIRPNRRPGRLRKFVHSH